MKLKDFFNKTSIRRFGDSKLLAHHLGIIKSKHCETGRSMVEILGVLAVIGVLSVSGIMGYRFAMDKYRANDIVNEVNLRNRDTWNMYQTKDLPDTEELMEWANRTQTGFPIGVYPRSNVVFDVQVDEVESRICKQVLNMNIVGPLFIWTPDGEGGKQIYNGTNARELCGEDEKVSMVFTTSLETYGADEGIRNGATDENGRPIKYCIDDGDCTNGCEKCDTDQYQCRADCPDGEVCHSEKQVCVQCEVNADCPIEGQICDDSQNTCIVPPQKCVKGVSYRSKNGACIPCTDINVFKISKEVFEMDEFGILDEETGVEQCTACPNHQVAEDPSTENTYCSVGCVRGLNYESLEEGCIPCKNADGSLNTVEHKIPRTAAARDLCTACHLNWTLYYYYDTCSDYPNCANDEVMASTMNLEFFKCKPCSANYSFMLWGWHNPFSSLIKDSDLQAQCNACPEFDSNGRWSKRRAVGNNCVPVCQQPTNDAGQSATEQIRICQADPKSKDCKRQFQNNGGTCLTCDASNTNNYVGTDQTLVDLCQNCGRKVKNGYCILDQECPLGTFKGSNGTCYNCTYMDVNFPVTIDNDELSGCTANCRKKNNEYSTDADAVPTRWVYTSQNGTQYCHIICSDKKWQNTHGYCYDCSVDLGWSSYLYGWGLDKEHCDNRCPSGIYQRHLNENNACAFNTCPPLADGTPRFQSQKGECVSCLSMATNGSTDGSFITQKECDNCKNRIYQNDTRTCVLIDPGVSGVCNSQNYPLSEGMPASLKSKVKPYIDGEMDGTYFRDKTGLCYRCNDSSVAPTTTAEQCAMCNIRKYSGSTCSYGGCQTDEFMNHKNICFKCSQTSSNYISDTYLLKNGRESSCRDCPEKQVLTQSSTNQTYCVPNNCIVGYEWQSAVTGTCQRCDSNVGMQEIGSEAIYQEQCRACGRIAFQKVVHDTPVWYCTALATPGTQFINVNGNTVSCTAGDTEIMDTNDARTLCTSCTVGRTVLTNSDGKLLCVKA